MSGLVPLVHPPGASVAVGGAGTRTAGALLRDARAIAARLPSGPGEVLVVCGDRYLVAAAALGAWLRGQAVALPPSAQPEAVRSLAARPGVSTLLHDAAVADAQDVRAWLSGAGEEELAARPWPAPLDPAALAATVYTSGTTGAHQACPKTFGQLLGEARALARTFALGPDDVVLPTVPPHHIYGLLFGVLAPLQAGATFARETPLHAETVAATARRLGATALVSTPAHLRGLTTLARGELPLRRVFSSGAPLPRATARELLAGPGLAVTEVYGSSETGGIGWRLDARPGEDGAEDGSQETAWTPLPGVHVAAAADGRLLLRSPFAPLGAPTPYVGEDRIEALPDGRFLLRGRVDGVLKVAGKRVALAEVEARLLALPGLVDAAALAQESAARGQEIAAAVVPRERDREPAEVVAEVRRELLRWFDPVVVPRRIKVVAALPREASGKLQRGRLLALLGLAPRRREFEVRALERREQAGAVTHTLAVGVPADLAFFEGHFEGRPILPAVAQVAALVGPQVAALHPELGPLRGAERLKFARPVEPGDALTLRLEVRGARVRFTLTRADEVVSGGTLEYEASRA